MKENLKDILSHLNPEVDQETLLLYLQGKLSAAQQHELEKGLMDDPFESEAMEGLQQFSDQKKLKLLVEQLNSDLKKKTETKKKRRRRLDLHIDPWVIATIIIVILLVVIGFVMIYRLKT